MTYVVVGSTSEGKLIAVRRAFKRAFGEVEARGVAVDSGVPAQPVGEQCFDGARNRAEEAREAARRLSLPGDYFVGIEGGVVRLAGRWFGFSVACVIGGGRTGCGTSPLYELPPAFAERVLNGVELGEVVRQVTGDAGAAGRRGAIGFLTHGLVTREAAHESGVLAALAPHLSPEWYTK